MQSSNPTNFAGKTNGLTVPELLTDLLLGLVLLTFVIALKPP